MRVYGTSPMKVDMLWSPSGLSRLGSDMNTKALELITKQQKRQQRQVGTQENGAWTGFVGGSGTSCIQQGNVYPGGQVAGLHGRLGHWITVTHQGTEGANLTTYRCGTEDAIEQSKNSWGHHSLLRRSWPQGDITYRVKVKSSAPGGCT